MLTAFTVACCSAQATCKLILNAVAKSVLQELILLPVVLGDYTLFIKWAWVCLVSSQHCLVCTHPFCVTHVHPTKLEIWRDWKVGSAAVHSCSGDELKTWSGNDPQACNSSLGEFKVKFKPFKPFCCSCWTGKEHMKCSDPQEEWTSVSSWPFFALSLQVKLLTLVSESALCSWIAQTCRSLSF